MSEKAPILSLYIDESGSRHPEKNPKIGDNPPWFGLGGILLNAESEDIVKARHRDFLSRWPEIKKPLHFTDMQGEQKGFGWLSKKLDRERDRFWSEYKSALANIPVAAIACVIDREGYRSRGYLEAHKDNRWLLCRSAFDILIDRAAKIAKLQGRRLRIRFELADPVTNETIKGYYKNLKNNGFEFNKDRSEKYDPISKEELNYILLDIEGKPKSSIIMQFADTYLYCLCRGKFNKKHHVYRSILEAGRLINSQLPSDCAPIMGVKYYCFDGSPRRVAPKNSS